MKLTRERVSRFRRVTLWLAAEMMAAAPWGVCATVASGVLARMMNLASMAGTFHILVSTVLSKMRGEPVHIPGVSEAATAVGMDSGLSAAVLAIACIFGLAGLFLAANTALSRQVEDKIALRVLHRIVANRVRAEQSETRNRKHRAAAFTRFARREYPHRYGWINAQIRLVLSIAQTGLVFLACLGVLVYLVPGLTMILVPLFLVFLGVSAPAVYRRQKRAEAEIQAGKQAVKAEQEEMGEAFVDAVERDEPGRFAAGFLEPPSRDRLRSAERQNKRATTFSDSLKLALLMCAFFVVLFYLYERQSALDGASGGSLIMIVVILLTVRFNLVYFRSMVGALFTYNARFGQLQTLYAEATGQDPGPVTMTAEAPGDQVQVDERDAGFG